MEDEFVLLKIKREWSQDEAVNSLLKVIAKLRFDIGVLESDLAEVKYEKHQILNKVKIEGTKTKKEWLKDELIQQYDRQAILAIKRNTDLQKSLSDYQNLYFNLKLTTQKKN